MSPMAGRLLGAFLALLAAALFLVGAILEARTPGSQALGWFLLAAALLMAGAAVYFGHRRWLRRFTAIRLSAEALVRGDPTVRAPVDGHDEVASLGRALNALASSYEQRLQDLRRERHSGDAVLESMRQGIALLSADLAIRHANARFWNLLGIGRPTDAPRLAATRQPLLEEVAEAAIRSGSSVTREVALYVGDRREYEVTVSPVGGAAQAGAWLLSIEDLGPERAMANLRREFVANASHELKTPLTSIRGYAETLLGGGLEDAENRARFVETIRAQAVRLEALVEDLLQLADLEAPDAALDLKEWDISAVVRDLADTFEDLAMRRGLKLEVEARPGIMVRLDRTRLDVALRNLLDNAVKYTDQGSVTVQVVGGPRSVRVSVSDTGRGVAPEHLSRLFERFYRVERGRSREAGGTGLGLSIVKHAIQLHGGRVGVTSRVGVGSTFWVEIPRDTGADRNGIVTSR